MAAKFGLAALPGGDRAQCRSKSVASTSDLARSVTKPGAAAALSDNRRATFTAAL
jgi:hypothetical protein